MMSILSTAKDLIKNTICIIDGIAYAGNVEEISLPKLMVKTEDFRNGGMNTSIPITTGLEPLQLGLTFSCVGSGELYRLVNNKHQITVKGSIKNELLPHVYEALEVKAFGLVTGIDDVPLKPGEVAKLKLNLYAEFYQLKIKDKLEVLIDAKNYIQVIGGFDQLASERLALGII